MNKEQHLSIVAAWINQRQLLPNGKVLRWVDESSAIEVEPSKTERAYFEHGKVPDWHVCVREGVSR